MAIQKNDFFSAVIKRQNGFKKFIYGFFISIASWPRLLLEVFVRKEFGSRYFSFSHSIILTVLLAVIPYAVGYSKSYGQQTILETVWHDLTMYIFLGFFMYLSYLRNKEIKKRPNVYSTDYYSLSSGEPDDKMKYATFLGKKVKHYTIVTLLEPAIFLIIGILMILITQYYLGVVLVVCSIIYRMSWLAQFALSHEYFLDQFDAMIVHDEFINSLTGGSNDKGFNPNNRYTVDEAVAKKVFSDSIDDEPIGDVG